MIAFSSITTFLSDNYPIPPSSTNYPPSFLLPCLFNCTKTVYSWLALVADLDWEGVYWYREKEGE